MFTLLQQQEVPSTDIEGQATEIKVTTDSNQRFRIRIPGHGVIEHTHIRD